MYVLVLYTYIWIFNKYEKLNKYVYTYNERMQQRTKFHNELLRYEISPIVGYATHA